MIFEPPRVWLAAVRPVGLSGEDEVVHPVDAAHGVVDAVAFEAAVAEDLPGLHPGEDVLNAGTDLLVGLVVRLLPLGQLFALSPTVRHDSPVPG